MRQRIIHDDLYDGHSNLVKAGAGTKFHYICDVGCRDSETAPLQMNRLKMKHITKADAERDDLTEDRSQCSTGHSHMKGKDKNRVKNCIYDGTYQHRDHRIARTSVGKNQFTHTGVHDQERKSDRSNSCILFCIRKNLFGCSEKRKHWCEKESRDGK